MPSQELLITGRVSELHPAAARSQPAGPHPLGMAGRSHRPGTSGRRSTLPSSRNNLAIPRNTSITSAGPKASRIFCLYATDLVVVRVATSELVSGCKLPLTVAAGYFRCLRVSLFPVFLVFPAVTVRQVGHRVQVARHKATLSRQQLELVIGSGCSIHRGSQRSGLGFRLLEPSRVLLVRPLTAPPSGAGGCAGPRCNSISLQVLLERAAWIG